MESKCTCGFNLYDLIQDAIDDSNEENFDGYNKCHTLIINCSKCSAGYEVEHKDRTTISMYKFTK